MKNSLNIILFIALALVAQVSYGEELISTEKAIKNIYKTYTVYESKKTSLSPEQVLEIEERAGVVFKDTHSPDLSYFEIYEGEKLIGYAFEDTVIGKWGPIRYLLGLNPKGSVLQVIILEYQEIRGKPIAKKRFLRQYKNKSTGDPMMLRRDIDGVTGATISSRSLTNGIRKLLFIFELYC